ncbi:hypothetical protein OI18_04620 [Flavihumibacter solisilvae]|uniref:Uncharacterized protein n=1 Tax=Flavihumibacter solisilvae TaxID=1349421 RepID=A0A0C1IYK7_9BACT|nr:hypothetical protein OI18_04620 [Flavihumibacter solisilvae]
MESCCVDQKALFVQLTEVEMQDINGGEAQPFDLFTYASGALQSIWELSKQAAEFQSSLSSSLKK